MNADGGICDRDVKLQVQDHGYDPQKAVSLYRSMSSDIVALQQVLGGPTSAAVLPLAEQDGVYLGGMGWSSVALGYDVAQMPGASNSIQAANAVDYLVDELGWRRAARSVSSTSPATTAATPLQGAQSAAKDSA